MREHLLEVTGIDRAEFCLTDREHQLVKRMTLKLQRDFPEATTTQEVLFENLIWYHVLMNRIKNRKTTISGRRIDPKQNDPEDAREKAKDWEQWPALQKAQMEVIKVLQGANNIDVNINSSVSDLLVALDKEQDGSSS